MVITIQNIIDEEAQLEVKCMGCQKIVIFRGERLLAELGRLEAVRDVQLRLKCNRCGNPALITAVWPDEAISRERTRNVLNKSKSPN